MLEKIRVIDNHEMLLVSQRAVFAFIGLLLFLTFALMVFFLTADFDYILGRKHLAMKVGQTSITLAELKKIQQLSGSHSQKLSEAAFATFFFETLLLAEGGRAEGLDQTPEFRKKIEDFDAALKNADDDETIARAAFLIEELAAANRGRLLNAVAGKDIDIANAAPVAARIRLHLRTILLPDASTAEEVIKQQAEGADFAQLNASYSISLYKSVGGDIGWKTANDFPDGVFSHLLAAETGTLVSGFTDAAGHHLFEVVSRPEEDPAAAARAMREQLMREMKKKALMRHTIDLRNRLDYWINPTLQVRCQVTPASTDAATDETR